MKKPAKGSAAPIPNAASLRKKAEEKFRATAVKTELTPEESQPLLHELRVHQIELEMQNEELRRTQAELNAAQARYFDLFNLAPVGYITVSEPNLILEANLTAATLLGLARSALANQPIPRFIFKEDSDIYYLRHQQLFKTGEAQTCELRMVKHDGTAFWARLQATVAPDDNGARVCRIVLSDISERKQIEETLQKSEENFRRSLDGSPLGVRIVTAKGETLYANRMILDLYGYDSMDEINRIPLKDRYTPQSYEEFHERLKARERGDFGPSVYEINIVRKNKEIRHLQVHRKDVIWNGSKQFQVIYQDITERKRAEEALRLSEEKFSSAFRSVSFAIAITRASDGKIIEVNDGFFAISGYTCKDIAGKTTVELNLWDHESDRNFVVAELAKGKKIAGLEFSFRKKSGELFVGLFTAQTLIVHNEECVLSSITDITERKRAEEALHESEARYRIFFDTSRDCVFISSLTGKWLYMNDAAVELFGYSSREELSQVNISNLYVNPEERAEYIGFITEHGYTKEFPVDLRRKDGMVIHALITSMPRYDADGNMLGFQGTVRDITERKRVEKALQESEERYRMLFNSFNDSVFLHETKPGKTGDFKFLEINDRACERLGYTRDEMLGMTVTDIDVPEQAQNVPEILRKLYTDGQVMFDTEHFSKDRVRIPMEINIRLVKYKGKEAILSVARDITERKRVENALRQSEEKWRSLVNILPDYVSLIDREGRFLFLNHYSEGFLEKDVIGSSVYQYLSPDSKEIFEKKIAECQNTGKIQGFEYTAMGDHGIMREYENYLVPILEKNKVVNIMVVARDITERKLTEKSIQSSLVEKELLLKEVHHRVKNNLMTIIGLIKMQGTKAANEMFNPLLLELEGRVRAMALVHESLHKSADLAHVNLQNYIETMTALIRVQFGAERDIRFLVQASGVDVGLDIAVPCGLIMNELIANACKHAFPEDKPRSGAGNCKVSVVMGQENGMLMLTVADNGVGLPAGVNWKNPETIGLQLIKMLSQQIGASLELDLSSGTVFRLKFPIAVS
jgi:PAS domain S-box-containing protein